MGTTANLEGKPYRKCVGIVLINADGLVFIAQRSDRENDLYWQMPQGGVEEGESLFAAALRELEEETSINESQIYMLEEMSEFVRYEFPKMLQDAFLGRFCGQEQKWFLFKFIGGDINLDTSHKELSHWKWERAEYAIKHAVPFKRHIYTDVFNEFKKYLAK